MSAHLHSFIDVSTPGWTLVHGYAPTASNSCYEDVEVATSGGGELYAAVSGKLSIWPPQESGGDDPTLPISDPDPAPGWPPAVTLYLHVSPALRVNPAFSKTAQGLNNVIAFVYRNVETSSLELALAELLDTALLPSAPRQLALDLLLRGLIDVQVAAGHAVGRATPNTQQLPIATPMGPPIAKNKGPGEDIEKP